MKNTPKRTLNIALVIALLGAVWFLWPQISVIILTILMAYMFYPLYLRLKGKKESSASSAILTLVASFSVVIIPIGFVIVASVSQLAGFAYTVSQHTDRIDSLPVIITQITDITNEIGQQLTGSESVITGEGVVKFIQSSVATLARAVINITLGILGNIPQLGIALLIYVFLFIEILLHGPKLIKKAKQLSPFDAKTTDLYLTKIGLMANAMVKGQLIIAMIFALYATILITVLGYGQYAILLFVAFTVLNFIPLGSGIVVVPMALYAMLSGQFWLGAIVIALYYLGGNMDPLLRTKLIPKEIQQSVAVTIIATFCGIAYFGMLGVVYGPIVMLLITVTLDVYRNQIGKQSEV